MESSSSEATPDIEVMKEAIKQLMEELSIRGGGRKISSSGDSFVAVDGDFEDHRRRRLLTKLLYQLEACKDEGIAEGLPLSDHIKENKEEEILKEMKKIKRQNVITHCLISVMIFLTLAWQVSEVSLVFKLKDGANHPFRSICSIFTWMLKGRSKTNGNNGQEKESSITPKKLIESSPLHDLKIPQFHGVELPNFDFGNQDLVSTPLPQ